MRDLKPRAVRAVQAPPRDTEFDCSRGHICLESNKPVFFSGLDGLEVLRNWGSRGVFPSSAAGSGSERAVGAREAEPKTSAFS